MARLESSVQKGLAGAAVILIVGALGFLIWQNYANRSEESNSQAVDTSETGPVSPDDLDTPKPADINEIAAEGTITGSLTYPSEGIPPELEIFAENIDSGTMYSSKDHIRDSRYKYGVGYKIPVPSGSYYVYGVLPQIVDQRAYYNNGAKCQLDDVPFGECADEDARIVVTVKAGQETDDIIIADWTATCVIPGGKQPTKKFDLPTC